MSESNQITNRKKLVSIISVNYNQWEVTCALLDSIKRSHYDTIETIIVDNGSKENDAEIIQKHAPFAKVIKSDNNLGFAGGNNLGLKYANGEYIFFVNNDTIIEQHTIGLLVLKLNFYQKAGAVSPKIKYEYNPSVIQYAGSTEMHALTLRNKHIGHLEVDDGTHDEEVTTNFIHGAAMMVRSSVIKEVGSMSEDYFLYYEELDWCERIKAAGHELKYIPSALIFHKESISTGKNSPLKIYYLTRNRLLFARKNRKGIQFLMSLFYLLIIAFPRNIFKYKFQPSNLKAYLKGWLWHLNNLQSFTIKF